MTSAESLTIEILKEIRSDLKEGLDGLRGEVQKTNQRLEQTNQRLEQTNQRLEQTNQRLDQTNGRLDQTNGRFDQANSRLENIKELQDLLVHEHRKTNQRLDFFAEELVRMRTKDNERLSALESAVAELQRRVG